MSTRLTLVLAFHWSTLLCGMQPPKVTGFAEDGRHSLLAKRTVSAAKPKEGRRVGKTNNVSSMEVNAYGMLFESDDEVEDEDEDHEYEEEEDDDHKDKEEDHDVKADKKDETDQEIRSGLKAGEQGDTTVIKMDSAVRRRREGLYWYGVSSENGATSRLPSYKFRTIMGPIQWAFDAPVEPGETWESDCLGLLMHHLTTAEKITWASYKPTHPEVVTALNSNSKSYGLYDGNYCTDCEDYYKYDREGTKHRRRRASRRRWEKYIDNDKVKAINMPVYKESSSRKWFVMHHKFAILDYINDGEETGLERVVTGSFNWNEGAAKDNYESIVQITSRPIAQAFYKEYKHAKYNDEGNTALQARASYAGNPGPVVDGDVTAAFNEHCATVLVERIKAAKNSILVAVWTMSASSSKNPNAVYDALYEAAQNPSITVKVLTDKHKAEGRDYGSMQVTAVHLEQGHFHHKFMVIDGQYVAVGSFNYVTKALSGNYENVVVINSRPVAKSFSGHWNGMQKKFAQSGSH